MRVASGSAKPTSNFWLLLGILGGVLLCLFHQSLEPHQLLFDNDHPLGYRVAECNRLPGRFAGTWGDLSWLGGAAPAASPSITMLLATLLPPVAFLKMYAPCTMLFLGFAAWLFFRQLNFSPMVCVLGGIAAGLNSHFYSIACWGLGNWSISGGCAFLALAALYSKSIPKVWERAVLAGLAVGMGLMEGYDVGAILSIYIGVFIVFRFLNDEESSFGRRIVNVALAGSLVVLFAAIIAYHTMHTLVETEVEGVAAMEQDVQTKETRWNPATQWSLPKFETLQIFVPGFFGYRLSGNIDQRDRSSAYWGLLGQDPRIAELGSDDPILRSNVLSSMTTMPIGYLTNLDMPDRHARTPGLQAITKKSGIYWRYTGSGECAGTIVSLLAIFGLANFFRKDGPYTKPERATVAFWGLVTLFSLLASWGRYGFLYQFLFKLPYISTIRNPVKFMNPFHIAWIILAAYGMEVLSRRYMRGPATSSNDFLLTRLQRWWATVKGFDRRWAIFMMVLAGASVAGAALVYVNKGALVRYLVDQNFNFNQAQGDARGMGIVNFCLQQCVLFVVFLAAGMLVIVAVLSGAWAGANSKLAWGCLATLMVIDLVRTDVPWTHYYDSSEKYVMNCVTDSLLDKPWEHRVIGKLEPRGPGSGISLGFGQLYFFWLQNDFPYHNIQTLDFPQMSHMPDLDRLYLKAFELKGGDMRTTDLRPVGRLWQLTDTRYYLGAVASMEYLNGRADPMHHSFKLLSRFTLVPKPGIEGVTEISDMTAQPNERGDLGIFEYQHALPRAKLYSNWLTPAGDVATLDLLTNPVFEPFNTVLIATNTPVPQPSSSLTNDPGEVTITDYHAKYVRLEADAKTQAILLLNDRTGPSWRVRVDGAAAPMLRCNYIMRGVSLTPGHHVVEFQFKPSLDTLYVSVSAIVLGIILAGYLMVNRKAEAAPAQQSAPTPAPPTPARPPTPAPPPAAAPTLKKQKSGGKAKRS